MSWLARSIANTLKFDESDENESKDEDRPDSRELDPNADPSSPRGVKDDLSEISKTLTRQFWGVASFLAPPAPVEPLEPVQPDPDSEPVGILGIRNDFAEIGGKFRTGISMISSNMNVSEITKMASNFLQLESDNEEDGAEGDKSARGAIGVTDDVVSFARDIAMHPETWLDFPLPDDEDDDDEFKMSDAQQEHALAVEQLAPRLAALRIELCPGYMNETSFWKIYFVLLHPRLEKEDALLLSTPQIVRARANLSIELQKSSKTKEFQGVVKDNSYSQSEASLSVPSSTGQDTFPVISAVQPSSSTIAAEEETEKHPVQAIAAMEETEKHPVQAIAAVEETEKHPVRAIAAEEETEKLPVRSIAISETVEQVKDQTLRIDSTEESEDDNDDWLKEEEEESTEVAGVSGSTVPIEDEEDVSFSDLEEDDEDIPASSKKASTRSDKDSPDWVQL